MKSIYYTILFFLPLAVFGQNKIVIPGGGPFVPFGYGTDSVDLVTGGTATTVLNGYNILAFNNSFVIPKFTVTLPTTWHSSKNLFIVFTANSGISTGQPMVDTLIIVNGVGQTLDQKIAPTSTFYAGETIWYHLLYGVVDHRYQ